MLIVFGGLPGTGKTTISKMLAATHSAVYLRIDAIEFALGDQTSPKGYIVAEAIALSNLQLGNWVVADSVNPVPESRLAWREVAAKAGAKLLEIELICSDATEHRRRVETRIADIEGFKIPNWAKVQAQEYIAWTEPRLLLDTAILSNGEAIAKIEAAIENTPIESAKST